MAKWQIKTPAVRVPFESLEVSNVDVNKSIVRWQFDDEETARRFMSKIHLEKIEEKQ